MQRQKSHVDVEEVVDHVPRTELLVLDPNSRSAQQSQQRLHGVHTYGDETPDVGVLALHARQGRRPREGAAAAREVVRLTGLCRPLAPPSYIQGILMGFYLIGPLVTLIPLGSISSCL